MITKQKGTNDIYGIQFGDTLIKIAAEKLESILDKKDKMFIYRLSATGQNESPWKTLLGSAGLKHLFIFGASKRTRTR